MFLTQKERIALICVDSDPTLLIGQEDAGGQNVYVMQVGNALAQQGWQVDMFTRRSSPEQAAIVQHSPNCRTIRLKAGPSEFIERDCLFDHLPEFIQEFLAFQAREGVQYRLIHTNYWLSAWVGMKLKKHQPLVQVHTYHSLGAVKYNSIRDIPSRAMKQLAVEKICLETVERVVATSPQEQENMRSLVSTQGQIEVIPCGTDTSKFGTIKRSLARQILGITPDTKMVLYVGRFDPCKGIETLVKAIAQSSFRHDNLKLVIAGISAGKSDQIESDCAQRSTEGDCAQRSAESDRIHRLVTQLGLTDCTIFPGRLDDTQLPYYYAAADVCVMPSYYEPLGLVAIEAMASRTPVVASNIGSLQFTVIPEVTGLLVPPKDESAFATAIDRILSNPTWRNQLGEAARHRVETIFNWQGVATRLSQLYSHLLLQASLSQAISASLHKSKIAA